MKPIRVMLVDDEIMAIQHIKSLVDWTALGFSIAAEAITASQALKMDEEVEPELIFMDIRMPAMDGLELSERILARNRKRIIYLLTSHQDFGYAKEAMRLGICGYLLKHDVTSRYLEGELAVIKSKRSEELKKERIIARQSLKELIETGKLSEQFPKELEEKLFNESGTTMFYIQADQAFAVIGNRLPPIRQPLPTWDDFELNEEQLGFVYRETVELAPDKQVALFTVSGAAGEDASRRQAHYAASVLQRRARRDQASVSVWISRTCRRPSDICEQFRLLETLSSYQVWIGKEQIVSQGALSLPDVDVEAEWGMLQESIREQSGDLSAASLFHRIETAFAPMEAGKFHPDLLKRVCYALVHLLEQLRALKGMPSYSEMFDNKEPDDGLWYTLSGIKTWFLREAETVDSYSESLLSYSNKVRKIIQYIHSHYGEDLTVETIAKALSLSGDHIRHLFKEEVGRTMTDYAIWYRMEQAKKLLRQDEYKVYEIAEMVGYRSSQYFSNAFKKWTGQTPQEYKEERGNRG